MAATGDKKPGKKTGSRKKTAASSPARKKSTAKKATSRKKSTAKKAISRKKTSIRKTVAKTAQRKKTSGRGKAATRKTSTRRKTAAKTTPKMTTKRATAAGKKAAKKEVTISRVEQIAPYRPKKGEEYMNENQREHFRALLLAWKRDLMEEADRTVHHMQDEASNFPDPNDRASQESEFSLELRTRDRERKLLRKIDKTLKRVEMDDYGWCDSCGSEIGIRRLEARPTATLCFDCKTLDEIRERQKGI